MDIKIYQTWDEMLKAMVRQDKEIFGDCIYRSQCNKWALAIDGLTIEDFNELDNAIFFYRMKRSEMDAKIKSILSTSIQSAFNEDLLDNDVKVEFHDDKVSISQSEDSYEVRVTKI